MSSWEKDKKWSDKFIPSIKRILGEIFIAEGDFQQDAREASDLIVLNLQTARFACRMRYNYYYNEGYQDQFTIRTERPNGTKTELAKIVEGWGDYIFYGFADEEDNDVKAYLVGDLSVFRAELTRYYARPHNPNRIRWEEKMTEDGEKFYSFYANTFPSEFFVREKGILIKSNQPSLF